MKFSNDSKSTNYDYVFESSNIADGSRNSINGINNLINRKDINNFDNSGSEFYIRNDKKPSTIVSGNGNGTVNKNSVMFPIYNKSNNNTMKNATEDERGSIMGKTKMNSEIQENLKKNLTSKKFPDSNGKSNSIISGATNKTRARKMENIKKCFDGDEDG